MNNRILIQLCVGVIIIICTIVYLSENIAPQQNELPQLPAPAAVDTDIFASTLRARKIDEHLTVDTKLRDVNFCGTTYQSETVIIDGVDVIQRLAELSQPTNITSASSTSPVKIFANNVCGTIEYNPLKNIHLGEISIYARDLPDDMMNEQNKTYGLYSSLFYISVTPYTNNIETVSAFDGAHTYLTNLK